MYNMDNVYKNLNTETLMPETYSTQVFKLLKQ